MGWGLLVGIESADFESAWEGRRRWDLESHINSKEKLQLL
jgi:hypothetical protein